MNMRVLSITAQKPDSTGSGVYLTELVKGFNKMNIEQAVIAGVCKDDRINLPENVRVFPVYFETKELPFPVVGMSDEMPYRSTRYSDMTDEMTEQFREAFYGKLAEALEKFCPDIVLCHHLYYLTAMVREICRETPVYGISHGSDLRQVKKNAWERDYISKWIPKLTGIWALHEGQKQEICEYYQIEEQKVGVVGTGYNSDVFYAQESGTKRAQTELKLIFAGKLSEKKGVMSLLRALCLLPDMMEGKRTISLVLAGGYGNEEEYGKIRRLAEVCPCQVEFTGRISQNELAKRMSESDVFVLPSFYEGLPLVIVEALACKAKVVCTDLPGIRSWLNANIPGNGVVFVTPPEMENEDEPLEETLPSFERRLAEAICSAEHAESPKTENVGRISWDGLCERLVEKFLASGKLLV